MTEHRRGSEILIGCSVEAHLVPLNDVFEFCSLLLLQVRGQEDGGPGQAVVLQGQ